MPKSTDEVAAACLEQVRTKPFVFVVCRSDNLTCARTSLFSKVSPLALYV